MIKLADYRNKLKAAFLGRAAGCTLGAPVEGWTVTQMEDYAKQLGLEYPLTDYWTDTPYADNKRYILQTFKDYTKPYLNGIPCDDDVGYTLLSLFIAEEGKGLDFTLEDVKNAWLKYITECYTAERVALDNLLKGIPAEKAGEVDNPYDELIGADIRCDGYGYMAPGNMELAARMAETDAFISHRKNGIYGSKYFASVISSAFVTNDVKTSLYEGLKYIPEDCELAEGIKWALDIWDNVGNYRNAAKLVDEKYPGMHVVHTINNACLTIFALAIGGKDFTKVIANCVAMAHDCDCTAATAGSIFGAAYGMDYIEEKWYKPFGNLVNSFFNGPDHYEISDILARYEKMALKSGTISG